jgi:hypothetical protein
LIAPPLKAESGKLAATSPGSGAPVTSPEIWAPAVRHANLCPTPLAIRASALPFRPDLLHSNDPAALHYQRQLAGAYLQEGLDKTGNLIDALHYYHGGPDRSIWGPKTRAYADAVIGRLGGQQ